MRDQKTFLDEKTGSGAFGCGNDDHRSGSHFCYGSRKKAGSMRTVRPIMWTAMALM